MTMTMKDHFGVFRDAATMQAGLDKLLALKERIKRIGLRAAGGAFNLDMIRTTELEGMLDVALATASRRAARAPSRAARTRAPTIPARDDADWLKHTLAHYQPEGPRLADKPVTLGMFEPKERTY